MIHRIEFIRLSPCPGARTLYFRDDTADIVFQALKVDPYVVNLTSAPVTESNLLRMLRQAYARGVDDARQEVNNAFI